MIVIKKTIVDKDIISNQFSCDLFACKGACCVEGDGGAPLEEKEINEIKDSFKEVKKYLPKKNLKEIQKQGFFVVGSDGDIETPLVNGRECVYSIKDKKGIIKKTSLEAYSRPRTNGINAIGIREGDELLEAKLTNGESEILMAIKSGRAIRFNESKVRSMGRTASGVRGITLSEGDEDLSFSTFTNAPEKLHQIDLSFINFSTVDFGRHV